MGIDNFEKLESAVKVFEDTLRAEKPEGDYERGVRNALISCAFFLTHGLMSTKNIGKNGERADVQARMFFYEGCCWAPKDSTPFSLMEI